MPRKRNTNKSASLGYGDLEQRQLLAFNFLFDGSTLTLNQSANDGVVMIDNSGPAGEFRINDGAGFVTYEAAENVVLNLMDNSSHLTVSLNEAHNGDLTINAGDGDRNILFASAGNTLDGQLSINAGAGSQSLSLAQISDLNVGGAVNIDTGTGFDSAQFNHSMISGGSVELRGVSDVNFDDAFTVGGDLLVDNSAEFVQSSFEKLNPEASSVSGRFTYFGSDAVDDVALWNIEIGGDINIKQGRGTTPGGNDQSFRIIESEFNNLTFESGDTTNLDYMILDNAEVYGDISVDMGSGRNFTELRGFVHGENVDYSSLEGDDTLLYVMGATAPSLDFSFGDGNDEMVFNGSSIVDMEVDFGDGDDQFFNSGSNFSHDARLINLDGFDVTYESVPQTLSFDQRTDATTVKLELKSSPLTNRIHFSGNDITTTSNLDVSMADNNLGSFEFYLEHQLPGNLRIDIGNGPRSIDFLGSENRVNGDFTLTAGEGTQRFYPDTISGFIVDGSGTIDLGETGEDLIEINSITSFAEGLNLIDVNEVDMIGRLRVNGNLNIDVTDDTETLLFHVQDRIDVHGDMNVTGSELVAERLWFDAVSDSVIHGRLNADFGANDAAANSQFIILNSKMTLESGLTLSATGVGSTDFIRTDIGSEISGDIFVDLGDGTNIGNFAHEVTGGEILQFVSGNGNDEVILRTNGLQMSYNVVAGGGDDIFTLEPSVNIGEMLRVDFGGGDDEFANLKGEFTWDTRLLGLYGFNNFYDPVTDSLRVHQLTETPDFGVSNDSPSGAFIIDLLDGGGYELTSATNLQVQLHKDSTTNVGVDLDKPLAGDLSLYLGQTSRDVYFVGDDNAIDGNLWVQAGLGDQNLHLSDGHDLTVGGDTMINLRQGNDSLFDGGNAMQFDNGLILRNVNNFDVSNSLSVGGNMAMESLWFTQDVNFDNDGAVQIDGKFTFLGSDGADSVSLAGNTTIGDDIYIRLGDNLSPGENQIVNMNGGFQAANNVSVVGGSSTGGNIVLTDDTTSIGGNMIVNFTGSSTANTAILKGQYGGNYGTFRGGNASDNLILDAIAEDMFWATLLHDGDDELTLDNSTHFAAKFIDFGQGEDFFADNTVEEFPKSLVNYP